MKVPYKSPYNDGEFNRSNLFFDVFGQMLSGALVAGGVLVGAGVFIYAIYLLGTVLPPESKEAEDPTPDSFVSRQVEPEEVETGTELAPVESSDENTATEPQ
ncbi:MAG: RC-LH1 core complex protein PufX [Pseudomonadota bacterium]